MVHFVASKLLVMRNKHCCVVVIIPNNMNISSLALFQSVLIQFIHLFVCERVYVCEYVYMYFSVFVHASIDCFFFVFFLCVFLLVKWCFSLG